MADQSSEPVSLRLDGRTLEVLRQFVAARNITISDAIRDAVELWLHTQSATQTRQLSNEHVHSFEGKGYAPAIRQKQVGELVRQREELNKSLHALTNEIDALTAKEEAARQAHEQTMTDIRRLEEALAKLHEYRWRSDRASVKMMELRAQISMLQRSRAHLEQAFRDTEALIQRLKKGG